MLKSVKLALALFGTLMIAATAASAAPLIGTGNPASGVPGDLESNWTILPVLDGSAGLYVVTGAADYPGAWVDPTFSGLTAQWISPYTDDASHTGATNDPNANSAFVDYTYTLADFATPGGDITIKWASDNGAIFRLNGVDLSTIVAPDISDTPFASLTTFTILASDAAWSALGNTFEVVVRNLEYEGANPTGLLVDISTVPLPPALLLFGSALVGMNWLRRRRDSSASMAARL